MARTSRSSGSAATDAALFQQIYGLLDSDQPGERQAALEKLATLRKQHGWPSFRQQLEHMQSAVPLAVFQAREAELAQSKQVCDALSQSNAELKRANATLRAAMWMSVNWDGIRRITYCVVATGLVGFGGYRLYHMLPQTRMTEAAKATNPAEERAFRDALSRTKYGEGDTPPAVLRIGDVPYWVIIQGYEDSATHSDSIGRPLRRECLRLYAFPAEPHGGGYITPNPRNWFGIKWPLRATECRARTPDGRVVASND